MTEAELREVQAAPKGYTLRNFTKHFITITHHKLLVGKFCFKMGLYKQGILHDLSKYMPTEFLNGVYFYLGFKSPIVAERLKRGYSEAWLHHKGRNRHHYEYWVDFTRTSDLPGGLTPIRMPRRYVAEMIADRVAASRVYHGKNYTPGDILFVEPKRFGGNVRIMDKDVKDVVKQVWKRAHCYSKNRRYPFGDIQFEFEIC